MIIKYRHVSDPDTWKTYDTEKSLRNNRFIHKTQEEFDHMELENMEKNKKEKLILEYKIQSQ